MKLKTILFFVFLIILVQAKAMYILIPMDDAQKDHLKSYGIAYWTLQRDMEVKWLLNYRGGSFLMEHRPEIGLEQIVQNLASLCLRIIDQQSAVPRSVSERDARVHT